MEPLGWIIFSGLLMCAIALIGSVALFMTEATFEKILLPLVALSAGTLIGGAFLHMIPEGIEAFGGPTTEFFLWLLAGFVLFFAMEQIIHWHHCRNAGAACKKPLGYLVLLGDGLHNFLGGLAVAGAFLTDIHLGIITLLVAAAHEVPQEMGDFGVLIHSGWSRSGALFFNMLSGVTFLFGGLVTYWMSSSINVTVLIPLAAGNFIYIGASDLVPEVNKHRHFNENIKHFLAFITGLGLMLVLRLVNVGH